MHMVPMADFALAHFAVRFERFVGILHEKADFAVGTWMHAANRDDCLDQLFNRGIFARLNEARLHAICRVNVYFYFFHVFILF
ncbi:MAG: hypothetical protein FD161_2240 [Limisphaerales bacterium]|nr:MAG: hypothetical protein FD161_2240 [Limisphaerales bacterium]KAG0508752.1 MAG: hypothetical protein E1N63_2042 [Limisphaerales bacterium]TXT50557.1 MAG: hypothetical protein FD140_2341 [Limisphaerales bacterium]